MDDLAAAVRDLYDDLRAGKWRDAYWWLNHQWLLWVGIAGVDLGVHYLKLRMQRSMLGVADV